ncbi:MAG: hypothetical protein WC223_05500 [Bacteroidales bacterium]|jgi:hypothetical protein
MKSTVGVYDSHDTALDAIEVLKDRGYPINQLSLMGQASIVDDNMRIQSREPLKNAGVGAGVVLGSTLGVLSGAGVFAIPGLGFIFGAGAVVGALAGFDVGLIGGGIVSILTTLGIKKDKVIKYNEHLNEGKFLVIAQGNEEEVEKAKSILCDCGKHLELCIN